MCVKLCLGEIAPRPMSMSDPFPPLYVTGATADVVLDSISAALGNLLVMANKLQINQSQCNIWSRRAAQHGGKSTESPA